MLVLTIVTNYYYYYYLSRLDAPNLSLIIVQVWMLNIPYGCRHWYHLIINYYFMDNCSFDKCHILGTILPDFNTTPTLLIRQLILVESVFSVDANTTYLDKLLLSFIDPYQIYSRKRNKLIMVENYRRPLAAFRRALRILRWLFNDVELLLLFDEITNGLTPVDAPLLQ